MQRPQQGVHAASATKGRRVHAPARSNKLPAQLTCRCKGGAVSLPDCVIQAGDSLIWQRQRAMSTEPGNVS